MPESLFAGNMPSALLFDLDGTLIDSAPGLALALDNTLQQLGYPDAGEEKARRWVGNGARVLVSRALADCHKVAETAVDNGELERALAIFFEHYQVCCYQNSCLYDGVWQALSDCQQQGIAMACVTNKPGRFTRPLLEHFQLDRFMPVAVSGDTLAQKKPAPEPLLHACTLLSADPAAALMIGDSVNDVQAARAADMPVICVNYGYNHGAPIATAQPDAIVSSLTELAGLMDQACN